MFVTISQPKKYPSLHSISKVFITHGQVQSIFKDENTESALEAEIDGNLRGSYPMEEVFKVSFLYL